MASQDLVDSIEQRISSGETKEDILQALLSEGWEHEEIEAAFANLPSKQPSSQVSSLLAPLWSSWDAKTASFPPSVVMAIFGLLACTVLVFAVLLYNFLDPLGARAAARDLSRDQEFLQTQKALQKYSDARGSYPDSLAALIPNFLTTLPLDPSTGKPLSYHLLDDQVNYELCVNFETRPYQCVSSNTSSIIPTIYPSDSPVSNLPTISPSGFSISGKVFIDYNENGVQDSGEPSFSDATLAITASSGDIVCSPKTDSFGLFGCAIADGGSYVVTLHIPVRYRITVSNPQSVVLSNDDPSKVSVSTLFGVAPLDSVPAQHSQ